MVIFYLSNGPVKEKGNHPKARFKGPLSASRGSNSLTRAPAISQLTRTACASRRHFCPSHSNQYPRRHKTTQFDGLLARSSRYNLFGCFDEEMLTWAVYSDTLCLVSWSITRDQKGSLVVSTNSGQVCSTSTPPIKARPPRNYFDGPVCQKRPLSSKD